jgi:type VI secretion system protein ImpD
MFAPHASSFRAKPASVPDTVRSDAFVRPELGVSLAGSESLDRSQVALIHRLIAGIDTLLNEQVNAILHHPRFQALEAAWRGLSLVVEQSAPGRGSVKVKVINSSWKELGHDFLRAADFDQSHLFDRLYSHEFGMPGGEPFGLLIGAYDVSHQLDKGYDDIHLLRQIAGVAAAAFCPFIAGVRPALFGIDSYADMEPVFSLRTVMDGLDHIRWRAMRRQVDMRFVGLALPRVLMRKPYDAAVRTRRDGFCFEEFIDRAGKSLLWGNAAFALGCVMIRRFLESGWFADIRGAVQDEDGAGRVSFLPVHDFNTEYHGFSGQPPVETRLNSAQEQELSDLGFVPVVDLPYTNDLVFNTNPSVHQPERYDRLAATQNARLSAMLQYVMCASRFAHYLKVMIRDQVGSVNDADRLTDRLNEWLGQYTVGNSDVSDKLKAEFPLRAASADVRELPGRPGVLGCTIHLQPHFQLDDVGAATFQLVTEMHEGAGHA